MTEYKIISVEKIQIEGVSVIDVHSEFSCEGREMLERKFNFPLATTAKEIQEELAKQCATIDSDFDAGVASAKVEEENKQADETIGSLLSKEETPKVE